MLLRYFMLSSNEKTIRGKYMQYNLEDQMLMSYKQISDFLVNVQHYKTMCTVLQT